MKHKIIKSNTTLVTGSSGFIGKALINRLISDNIKVNALTTRAHLIDLRANVIEMSNYTHDISNSYIWENVDTVIHLAARVHNLNENSQKNKNLYLSENVDLTLLLAKEAAAKGVKRFIFLSTIKVNGESTSNGDFFSPEDIPMPQDNYSFSKLQAEIGLVKMAKKTFMDIVIIRAPLVYGPYVKGNFLNMMKWLNRKIPLPFGSINNRRSLVFIDNLVDLIITCINHPKAKNQVFMVSDDYDVSTTFLLRKIRTNLGHKDNLYYFPSFLINFIFNLTGRKKLSQRLLNSLQVDISKTKKFLNWYPHVSFEEGIKRTTEHFIKFHKLK